MADVLHKSLRLVATAVESLYALPLPVLLVGFAVFLGLGIVAAYLVLYAVAPKPRLPLPSEKTYQTPATNATDNNHIVVRQLPCWFDKWQAEQHLAAPVVPPPSPDDHNSPEGAAAATDALKEAVAYSLSDIEPAEVGLTVVVPAYNEAKRILPALEEMVAYCDKRFGRTPGGTERLAAAGQRVRKKTAAVQAAAAAANGAASDPDDDNTHAAATHDTHNVLAHTGYEILVVDDASGDGTAGVVLAFARAKGLADVVRVVTLARNRGKGGGVTHGFRHARGAYVVFADADGASRFTDLDRLRAACDGVADAAGRAVAIGSRAHLVGSAAVVQRSRLRNLLMKAFHFVLMILTPPATSRIRDTQCGFKLFTRPALPHIVPYMHSEGWIFDIEMLMLAESAPPAPLVAPDGTVIGTTAGIKVAEVPIAWHEVDGSKMNLVQDSIRMAIGLTVLRASWMLGVYRRRLA